MPLKLGKNRILYLASRSERRRDLLKRAKIPFRVVPSAYREKNSEAENDPSRLVIRHALGKARRARLPAKAKAPLREIILGADTIVWFRGHALGKPRNIGQARDMLRKMSGRIHWVYTGMALIDRRTGRQKTGFEKTRVRFRKWGDRKIDRYLAAVNPLDKAGAYAIQAGPRIVESYRGSYTNVVGLPCEKLLRMLRSF